MSIIITLIYTYYYTDRETADIFKYFDDSKILFNSIKNKPIDFFQLLFGLDFNTEYFQTHYYSKMSHWNRTNTSNFISDSHLITRLNMFIRLFSFGYYQVHNVVINFISLFGLVAIYKAFQSFFISQKKLLFGIICFIPSVLFWGSGLLKESIVIFALGFLLLHFFKLFTNNKLQSWVIIILMSLVLLFTKLNVIIALIPSVMGYIIYKKRNISPLKSYLAALLILIVLSFASIVLFERINPTSIIINKQQDFINEINRFEAKSVVAHQKFNSLIDIVAFIPNALINVFLRPFVWESYSVLTLFSALENIALLLMLLVIFYFRKKKKKPTPLFYFCLVYALTSALIIGLTTPILGAIARYKIFTSLFLILAFLQLVDVEKFKNSWLYTIYKK